MTKPVRYYIRKDGEQPTVRTVPVVAQSVASAPRSEQPAAQAAAPARVHLHVHVSGVRRIREAIKRGGGV